MHATDASIAYVIVGALGIVHSKSWGTSFTSSNIEEYPDVRVISESLKRHVVHANGGQIDLFMMSWQKNMEKIFKTSIYPAFGNVVAARYEDNSCYQKLVNKSSWSQLSYSLSISFGAKMVTDFVSQTRAGLPYSAIVFARADLMYLADFVIPALPRNTVYCDCCLPSRRFPNGFGDNVLVVRYENLDAFVTFFDANTKVPGTIDSHHWIFPRLREKNVFLLPFADTHTVIYRNLKHVKNIDCEKVASYGMRTNECTRLGIPSKTPKNMSFLTSRDFVFHDACHRSEGEQCFMERKSAGPVGSNVPRSVN